MTIATREVSLVLPIKDTARAKSRLNLPRTARRQVAMALARHALEVAAQCLPARQIYVVTSDEGVRELAGELGTCVVADPGRGLNQAIECGVKEASCREPRRGVLVLVCDLPEVEAQTLNAFLRMLEESTVGAMYVADRSGFGTTAVFCPPGVKVRMVFGRGSAAQFEALGCHPIGDVPGEMRSDLDTLDDLKALRTPFRLSWLHSARAAPCVRAPRTTPLEHRYGAHP